jgi:hypothetical protein
MVKRTLIAIVVIGMLLVWATSLATAAVTVEQADEVTMQSAVTSHVSHAKSLLDLGEVIGRADETAVNWAIMMAIETGDEATVHRVMAIENNSDEKKVEEKKAKKRIAEKVAKKMAEMGLMGQDDALTFAGLWWQADAMVEKIVTAPGEDKNRYTTALALLLTHQHQVETTALLGNFVRRAAPIMTTLAAVETKTLRMVGGEAQVMRL